MEFYVLDNSRQLVGIMDYSNSSIWTPRYNDVGDFELQIPASSEVFDMMKEEYYVTRLDDDMIGIIERVLLTSEEETGSFVLVSGRDAKCILERRIVWTQTNLSGTVEDCIRRLIIENIISPTDSIRAIPNFILGERKGFTEKMEMQVTGDNLLELITKICKAYGMGFKVTFVDGQFVFDLYKGIDRSYRQTTNPRVSFSPEFDNVIRMEYESNQTNLKNVALVAGEGEGLERKTTTVGAASGLSRRELYVDARDISSNEGEIEDSIYMSLLAERGNEILVEHAALTLFSGEIEPSINYAYKQDYFVGDIIQITNEYGITTASRVSEIIECEDNNGYSITPTFEEINE